MTLNSLDRLLTTLDVQLHAFAVCEVAEGSRLVFAPMNVVVVHYVLSGTGTIEVNGSTRAPIEAGCIVIVPPGRKQGLNAGGNATRDIQAEENCATTVDGLIKFDAAGGAKGDLRVICSTFSATFGGSFGLFDSLVAPIVDDATDLPVVRGAFEALAVERSKPDIGTHALCGALMKQCLILLIRRHLHRGSVSTPFFASLADPRLTAAVALVLEMPGARLTVAELAGAAGMSRTAFSKTFAEAFAQTPMDFVQKTRLHRAAQLLASTELPVKVIAASMGFASRSHFSRAFSRAYSADPTKYRKHHDRNAIEAPSSSGRSWLSKITE